MVHASDGALRVPYAGVRTFFTINQGHAFGAPGRPAPAGFGRGNARASRERASWRGNRTSSRGGGRAPRRLRGGRHAAPCRAGALWARRRHQVSRPARRQAVAAATREPMHHDRENWQDRPPRAGHSLAAQRSLSRARLRHVLRMAQAPPQPLIFHGKTQRLSGGRGYIDSAALSCLYYTLNGQCQEKSLPESLEDRSRYLKVDESQGEQAPLGHDPHRNGPTHTTLLAQPPSWHL
jgi:hypothetical protein